jgi:hypothetical protein
MGGSHDESLLSPYLSLEVDWVAGQPNAGSCDTERTIYHHTEKKNLWVKHLRSVNPLEEPAPASVKFIIISITVKQLSGENMNTSIKENN